MQNYIEQLNITDIVISLYHPRIFHLYGKFKAIFDQIMAKDTDEPTRKLYAHLKDIDTGLTVEGFGHKCQSLGFSDDMNKYLLDTYAKYCELQDDDYRALYTKIRNFALNEEIKQAVTKYNANHEVDEFIDHVANLQVSDLSGSFNDAKLFSSRLFGDIDVESVQENFDNGVLKSSFGFINDSVTQGGYLPKTMVTFAAPTKCGKSMVAMQETISFLKQGFHVLYAAFGDLAEYDMLVRLTSQINNRPLQYTGRRECLKKELELARKKVPQLDTNLEIQFLAPDKFTAAEYVDYLKNAYAKDGVTKLHDWADVIIIDYDSNIKSKFEDNMYKKGEDIYQTLYQLVNPNKLVFVLAQTAKPSWENEVVHSGELGESSRKQMIVDMLITISHPAAQNQANNIGAFNLCLNRRGDQKIVNYMRDISGKFYEISNDAYTLIKASSDAKTFIPNVEMYGLKEHYTVIGAQMAKAEQEAPQFDAEAGTIIDYGFEDDAEA